MLDTMDIKILTILQEDSTLPVAEIGKKVGLSTTPCWRRIQKLEQDGVIQRRVALLDPQSVSAGVTVFVAITTNQHNAAWLERFNNEEHPNTSVRTTAPSSLPSRSEPG